MLQSFASLWLLPRLAAFKSLRPDIDVQVETSSELVDLVDERFDAAIRFGSGRWPGLVAERLFPVRLFPVAASGLLPAGRPISAAALDKTTLLDIAQAPDLWPQYLAGVGLRCYQPRRSQTFDNAQAMFAAVANGLGLALAARELVERQLKSGRPVAPFSRPVAIRQSYYLVYTRERQDQPALKALRRALGPRALSAREATRSSFVVALRPPLSVR